MRKSLKDEKEWSRKRKAVREKDSNEVNIAHSDAKQGHFILETNVVVVIS